MRAAICLAVVYLAYVTGHGILYEPPSRNSAYRQNFNTTPDYQDMGHNCGSFKYNEHGCAVCGNTDSECPSQTYCKNVIVRTYKAGATIPVTIKMFGNHGGVMQYKLCPSSNGAATWDCLDKHKLQITEAVSQKFSEGGTVWQEPGPDGNCGSCDVQMHVKLPDGLKCDRCVFQWQWSGANMRGVCANGTEGMGCGPQQTYIACADIKIQ